MSYENRIETDMKRIGFSLLLTLISVMAFSQDEVVDYLHVGKTLKFQDKKFELKWCQHPIEAFFLQEWLPKGETFDNYEQMLSVSLSFSETLSVKYFVDAKVHELEERKKSDKCCNYLVYENDGEYIIDLSITTSPWSSMARKPYSSISIRAGHTVMTSFPS